MKNKGGRGKTNSFNTIVMRVPFPLREEIEKIISDFYELNKPVTTLEVEGDNKPVTTLEVEGDNKPVTTLEVEGDNKPVTTLEVEGDKLIAIMKNTDIKVLGLEVYITETIRKSSINTIYDLMFVKWHECDFIKGIKPKETFKIKSALIEHTRSISTLGIMKRDLDALNRFSIRTLEDWSICKMLAFQEKNKHFEKITNDLNTKTILKIEKAISNIQ